MTLSEELIMDKIEKNRIERNEKVLRIRQCIALSPNAIIFHAIEWKR